MRFKEMRKFLCLFIFTIIFSFAQAAFASDFVSKMTAELNERGMARRDLIHVYDEHAGLNVFYDSEAYEKVFKKRGDEAFSMWFNELGLNLDKREILAVVLTNQRIRGVSFGFTETQGIVIMSPSHMLVFDNPWGTVGRFLEKCDQIDYQYANIGDGGSTFIVGKRRYKNASFAGLLMDMKKKSR